jgi:hypothetical protein
MELTLINDLFESRLFPSRNSAKRYTVEEIANMTFLNFLAVQILKSEFDTAKFATDYLYQTFKFGNFDRLQSMSSDLFWMLHILLNKDLDLLNDHHGNELEMEKISLNDSTLKTWARQSIKARANESVDRRFLLSLESMLCIRNSDYRSIRLLVSSWSTLTDEQRQLAMTRLLFAFRKRMPRSELLSHLENLAKHKKLEIHGAIDPETETHEPTKGSLVKKLALGAAFGAAIALPALAGVKRYKEFKSKIDAIPTHRVKEDISEDAAAGSTSAASIATVVQPMMMTSRTGPKVKRGNRKKKV